MTGFGFHSDGSKSRATAVVVTRGSGADTSGGVSITRCGGGSRARDSSVIAMPQRQYSRASSTTRATIRPTSAHEMVDMYASSVACRSSPAMWPK
jgi:hypothetical protein